MSRPGLRITSPDDHGDNQAIAGHGVRIEVQPDGSDEWVDMSGVVSEVVLRVAAGEIITATLRCFPSAVKIDDRALTEILVDPAKSDD